MQFGNPQKEYMSRKYTLTLVALIAECYKLVATKDPTWATALCIAIPATIAQYAYFNTQEAKIQKNGNGNGVSAIPAAQPPVEPAGQ